MSDDNVAASSKNVKGIEVIPAGQAIDVADDIFPPLSRSQRKSWATDTKTITLTTTVGYFSFFTPRHYLRLPIGVEQSASTTSSSNSATYLNLMATFLFYLSNISFFPLF